ncbi:hypothetical protein ACOSQ2_014237 [Xanthoceras sorbifolium]
MRSSQRNESVTAEVSTLEMKPDEQQTKLTDVDGAPVRVNMYCHIRELKTLQDVLSKDNMLDKWKECVFSRFSRMRCDQLFIGKLCHSLLCREIHYPEAREDEIWFAVGGHAIRFGKEEFLLHTG